MPPIAPTQEQFLTDFSEFDTSKSKSKVQISPSTIMYYLNLAPMMLNANRFCELFYLAVELFVAHHVVLETLAQNDMKAGSLPGLAKGIVAGKSAADVSISYDTGSVLEPNAGHWNYTVYGKRLYSLMMNVAAGPLQIGPGGGGGPLNGPAWFGPPIDQNF